MNEIQALVSIAANGSVVCMHMALTWLMGMMQQNVPQPDGSLVERAVSVTSKRLNLAMSLSGALVDRKPSISSHDKGRRYSCQGCDEETSSSAR